MVQVTEVKKGWRKDPFAEDGFENLMYYDRRDDELKPTRALKQSELIASIARKWGVAPRDIIRNLELRVSIQGALVDASKRLQKPELLEADFVVRSNIAWHSLFEGQLRRGRMNYRKLFVDWSKWLRSIEDQAV